MFAMEGEDGRRGREREVGRDRDVDRSREVAMEVIHQIKKGKSEASNFKHTQYMRIYASWCPSFFHKSIRIYMEVLILGANTLYNVFCFFKALLPKQVWSGMVGKGLKKYSLILY